jgi:anti-sigma B factor antagonist
MRVSHGACARLVMEVGGELDLAAVNELRERLLPATEHGTLVLDMSAVTFFDSGGARILLEADQSARRHGAAFRVAAPSDSVRRVLAQTGTDQTIEFFADVESALLR